MRPASLATFACLLTALVCAAAGGGEPAARPADKGQGEPLVRVEGHVITTTELDRYVKAVDNARLRALAAVPMSAVEREEWDLQRKGEALREMVRLRLLYELAVREYLGSDEARRNLENRAEEELRKFEQRVGSRPQAMQLLAELGLTADEFKEMQKLNLMAATLLWDKALSRVNVSPAEARAYYEQNVGRFRVPRKVTFRQVFFAVADSAEGEAQRRQAEQVLAQVKAGADFAALADRHSADARSYPGGLHEVAVPEEAGEWTPPAVTGLAPGETSDVRPVAGGYAIARLEVVEPARQAAFEEVQAQVRAALLEQRRAEAEAAFLAEVKRTARVDYFPAARQFGLP